MRLQLLLFIMEKNYVKNDLVQGGYCHPSVEKLQPRTPPTDPPSTSSSSTSRIEVEKSFLCSAAGPEKCQILLHKHY